MKFHNFKNKMHHKSSDSSIFGVHSVRVWNQRPIVTGCDANIRLSNNSSLFALQLHRCVQSSATWYALFRKTCRRVAPIVKDPKNERTTLAWRIFIFLPIQKIRLQKKLAIFEDTLNRMLLRSVYFNKTPTAMENEGWCSTGFLIENRCVLQQMHAISIQNRITFTWRRIFWIGKK